MRILNRFYNIIKTNETNELKAGMPCRGLIVVYFSEILLDGQDIGLYYGIYIVCARVGGSVRSVRFPG